MTGDADTYAAMLAVSLSLAVPAFVIASLSLLDVNLERRARAAAMVAAFFAAIMSVALAVVHLRDGHGPADLEPMGIAEFAANHPAPFLIGGGAIAALIALLFQRGARAERTRLSDLREKPGDHSSDDR